jgi:hypothetical protein
MVDPPQDAAGTADAGDPGVLARRAVDVAIALTSRAAWFSLAVTISVIAICVGSFLLGIAALDDGIETVWIVLGGVFAVLAISAAVRATWRVSSVRRHAGTLVGEMKQLITRDPAARRTVIETVEVGEAGTRGGQRAVLVSSRGYGSFGGTLRGRAGEYPQLARAVAAVTTFPLLLLLGALVAAVFAALALIFLLALAL